MKGNDMKQLVTIIFGGQSSEHEISCLSAQTVIKNIDSDKYETLLIGITREGRWLLVENVEQIADGSWTESPVEAIIAPDASLHGAIICENDTPCFFAFAISASILRAARTPESQLQNSEK